MIKLDVDELVDALTPPTITIGGTDYEGRYPTFLERWEIEAQMDATDWQDEQSQKAFLAYLCEKLAFPLDALLTLPEAILSEVVLFCLAISRGQQLDAEVAESESPTP